MIVVYKLFHLTSGDCANRWVPNLCLRKIFARGVFGVRCLLKLLAVEDLVVFFTTDVL